MKNWKRLLTSQQGFTLTEMLIVIALIAMVGTFAISQIMSRFTSAKISATKIQMKNLGVVLDNFKLDCGFYPTSDQGLEALAQKPAGGRECKNYDAAGYLKGGKIPTDGFSNPFLYESDGSKYVLKSLGNDNKEGGDGEDKDLSSDALE
jgi:general secretion pathway protein G